MAEILAIFLLRNDGALDIRHERCEDGDQHPAKIYSGGEVVPMTSYGKLYYGQWVVHCYYGQWVVHCYCGLGVHPEIAGDTLSQAYTRGLAPFVQREN